MRILISIFFILTLASCSKKNKVPEGILSQHEMRLILWDLIRADEYISSQMLIDSTVDINKQRFKFYGQIFSLHSADREKFKKSLSYYTGRPELLKVIVDSLKSDERKVTEFQNRISNPVVDSIPRRRKINFNH